MSFFNMEFAAKMADDCREEILAGDQIWRQTVRERWVKFQIRIVQSWLRQPQDHLGMIGQAPSKALLLTNVAQQLEAYARELQRLARILRGTEQLDDPLQCEVMMRLHDKATGSASQPQ